MPLLGAIIVAVTWGYQPPTAVLALVGLLLAGCVFAAVHHAEVVAHRVGEPFGALILAVAVTVIEVGLIVMLMVSGGSDTSTLARDTVFAAAMITCNGIVGLALLVGSLQPGVASFKPEGTAPALATVATLATLTLVLPTFTTSTPGPEYSAEQLGFGSVASLALYLLFVFVQTVRDRVDFLPDETDITEGEQQTGSPSGREALASLGMLVVGLVAVVGLAKVESPAIEGAVAAIDAPPSAVGVMIALLVLLPGRWLRYATLGAAVCRSASTWPSARLWPASGSPSPLSPSHQSGCPAGLYGAQRHPDRAVGAHRRGRSPCGPTGPRRPAAKRGASGDLRRVPVPCGATLSGPTQASRRLCAPTQRGAR